MTLATTPKAFAEQRFFKPFYFLLLFVMGLTGFGQMPIFKRYYIADIPGLAWLANFYTTHYIHYIGAASLFGFFVYAVVVYFGLMRKRFRLTWAAYVRIALLALIAVTGIFRVLKNLPDVVFLPKFTMVIDISHLAFMMFLMVAGIVFIIIKKGWLVSK
ncbi:MAG: FeS-binding protein [Deltaproteobacteria bacterium]|jgi:heme A synthase|nr:FeS-binding protein [Deltaproteobacteria bacterium]